VVEHRWGEGREDADPEDVAVDDRLQGWLVGEYGYALARGDVVGGIEADGGDIAKGKIIILTRVRPLEED